MAMKYEGFPRFIDAFPALLMILNLVIVMEMPDPACVFKRAVKGQAKIANKLYKSVFLLPI